MRRLPAFLAALSMLPAAVVCVRRRSQCAQAACVGEDDEAFHRDLIDEARVVLRFGDRDPSRYLSVLGVGEEVWVAARFGSFPSADGENISARIWTGCDATLRSADGSECVGRDAVEVFRGDATAHNLGFFLDGDELYALGGLFDARDHARDGVRVVGPVRATRAGLADLDLEATPRTVALGGAHPGGIDRRPRTGTFCEYDGRVSAAATRSGRLAVYARANLARNATVDGGFGGRRVQAAVGAAGDPHAALGPLEAVRVDGYPPRRGVAPSCEAPPFPGDNVYFAAVNANPVDGESVLGLFPVVRNEGGADDDAYVAMAVSCDGLRFSKFLRLVDSTPASLGRGSDHPVDGLLRRGDDVFFFVHRGVLGVFDDDHDTERINGSRVVRYSVPAAKLAAYTARAKASLPSCRAAAANRDARSHYDVCWLDCAHSARARQKHFNVRAVDACFDACLKQRAPAACGGASTARRRRS